MERTSLDQLSFRNYTESSKAINASEFVPLLEEASSSASAAPPTVVGKKLSMNNSKVAPIGSKATLISKSNTQPASVKSPALGFKPYTVSLGPSSSSALKTSSSKDIKKSESVKNEEKLKQKAEKEAKKVFSKYD